FGFAQLCRETISSMNDFWCVEWLSESDALSVIQLSEYVRRAQAFFDRGEPYCCVPLAVFPSEASAREQCKAWNGRIRTACRPDWVYSGWLLRRVMLHFGEAAASGAGLDLSPQLRYWQRPPQ